MDFSLNEEQILLRDSVTRFVAEHCDVDRHRALAGSELGFDESTWRQFAELGWLAVPFSADNGGFDGGAVELMVVSEALGAAPVREPYLSTVVTCGGFLQAGASARQQGDYVPCIIYGSNQWAFAYAERGSDFDLANLSLTAAASGDAYTLDGRKMAVLNGHCADYFIVSANIPGSGPTLFIVTGDAAGLSREPFVAIDGSRGAHIGLEGVQVAAEQVLGEPGAAADLMDSVLDSAIVAIGGEALGAMQALLDATVEYTRTREQFGQPISNFQVLQHRMAQMYLKVEETRSLLLNAAIAVLEDSAERATACAALKVKVAEAGRHVSQEAVQLHGGIGMTDELVVGHHYKRLLLLSRLYGDESYHLSRYIERRAA